MIDWRKVLLAQITGMTRADEAAIELLQDSTAVLEGPTAVRASADDLLDTLKTRRLTAELRPRVAELGAEALIHGLEQPGGTKVRWQGLLLKGLGVTGEFFVREKDQSLIGFQIILNRGAEP